jgi:hypothetical protein
MISGANEVPLAIDSIAKSVTLSQVGYLDISGANLLAPVIQISYSTESYFHFYVGPSSTAKLHAPGLFLFFSRRGQLLPKSAKAIHAAEQTERFIDSGTQREERKLASLVGGSPPARMRLGGGEGPACAPLSGLAARPCVLLLV